MNANRKAFLSMIAHSEIGDALLAGSDNGYNVIVGSTAEHPNLFTNYADHPRQPVYIPSLDITSTAAGRYQILARYFDAYKKQLHLPDFAHSSQDAIALQMIGECHALRLIDSGEIDHAITACSSRWASLPGASYGQHTNKMDDLIAVYLNAGGELLA